MIIGGTKFAFCRKNTPRAKVYDVKSGKEMKKIDLKGSAAQMDFITGMQHIAVCCQDAQDKKFKAPTFTVKTIV